MATPAPPNLEHSIAAVQAWWRGAGVDFAFHDEPAPWLVDEAPAALMPSATLAPEPMVVPAQAAVGGDRSTWPSNFSDFSDWWLTEPSLDHGGSDLRVAPRGPADAELMMLVPMPEPDDRESLLSGTQGRLLASLAQAMGLAAERVYLAAVLPRHSAVPDWERLAAQGWGDVLRHHIALAKPAKLIVFGSRLLPLLGHDPTQGSPAISEIDIDDRHMPLLATFAPERLLGNLRQRAGFWQRWLEWTDREA